MTNEFRQKQAYTWVQVYLCVSHVLLLADQTGLKMATLHWTPLGERGWAGYYPFLLNFGPRTSRVYSGDGQLWGRSKKVWVCWSNEVHWWIVAGSSGAKIQRLKSPFLFCSCFSHGSDGSGVFETDAVATALWPGWPNTSVPESGVHASFSPVSGQK